MIKKVTDNDIIEAYGVGWEHSNDDRKILDWFDNEYEKAAYFLGFDDAEMNINRSKPEILEFVKS